MTRLLQQPRAGAVADVNTGRSRTGVVAEINRLTVEERKLSDERNELHARIDAIYLSAPLTAGEVALLDELEGLEFNLSSRRTRLHLEIDVLRAEVGLPPWRQSRYDTGDQEQPPVELV
jgi:malate synthase